MGLMVQLMVQPVRLERRVRWAVLVGMVEGELMES